MEQIAYEKCGIIKEGAPVVCYPDQPEEALEVIFRTAALRGSAVILPNPGGLRDLSPDSFSPRFSYGGREYTLRLLGAIS